MVKKNNGIIFILLLCAIISILCIALWEPKPQLPISNTLEIALNNKYSKYVHLLNKASDGDSIALRDFLKIDYVYDAAGYDHGWILIQVMKKQGDVKFSNAILGLNQEEISNVKAYVRVGMMNRNDANAILIKFYPKTFHNLGFTNIEINNAKYY